MKLNSCRAVAELLAQRPGAAAVAPRLPIVGHVGAAEPEPEEQRDQIGRRLPELEQAVADHRVQPKALHAPRRQLRQDPDGGTGTRRRRDVTSSNQGSSRLDRVPKTMSASSRRRTSRNVNARSAGSWRSAGEHRHVVARGLLETAAHGVERAEIPAERHEHGGERRSGEPVAQELERAVGAAVDDADHFDRHRADPGDPFQLLHQAIDVLLVPVNTGMTIDSIWRREAENCIMAASRCAPGGARNGPLLSAEVAA